MRAGVLLLGLMMLVSPWALAESAGATMAGQELQPRVKSSQSVGGCFSDQPSSRVAVVAGDILRVEVWQEPNLQKEVLVRPDGFFSFPLVGEVDANGRTVAEVSRLLEEQLRKYIPDVSLSVMTVKAAGQRAFVIGKVNRPSDIALVQPTTVLQALSLAGGMNAYADTSHILIKRSCQGKAQVFGFDYNAVAGGDELERDIYLSTGDVIIVP